MKRGKRAYKITLPSVVYLVIFSTNKQVYIYVFNQHRELKKDNEKKTK